MSRKSVYFTVPAVAVAATFGAGSANAAIMIDTFDYSAWDNHDVTIGGNATAQYKFTKTGFGEATLAGLGGSGVVGQPGSATIGTPGLNYGNAVITTDFHNPIFFDKRYYQLRFDLNGATTFGYATVTDGSTLATVHYEVSAVPEPATWALAILGFGLAGAAMRRRQGALATA